MGDKTDCFPELTEKLKERLMNNDWVTATQILEDLKKLKDIPLDIGILGESGTGKSSFVNAFRGIDDSHEEAAPTDCIGSTSDIKSYRHPKYPKVTLWDLNDVGPTSFPADKYLKDVRFRKFDFFIIISATRFRENDVKLALEIQKMGKKFYFVRSKIDNDMRAEQRSKTDFDVEKSLTEIRQDCIQGLQSQGFDSPQVFLLSSFEFHLYDFSLLHETFKKELPALRRHALPFAVADINQEIIKKKKDAFQAKIKYYAAISAAGAAIRVPGLSIAVDAGLMIIGVRKCKVGLGLDEPSLEKLAANTGVPFEDVKATIRSPLATAEITKYAILKVLGQLSVIAALTEGKNMSSFLPILGTIAAMCLSSFTTYRALNSVLDTMADNSQRVFKRAMGL